MARPRSEIPSRLGRRLRALREARGRTQEEVAERAGYSGKYISEIERGLRDPPLTTLERIAERGIGSRLDHVLAGLGATKPNPGELSVAEPLGESAPERLPRVVRQLADDIAALPTDVRQCVVRVVRDLLALTAGQR